MQLNEKDYSDFKALCEKKGIKYDSEAEYREASRNMVEYVKLTLELAMEQRGWEERLEKEPKGFAISSNGRTCCLCYKNVVGEVWYDKWGLKCMTCQNALNKKIVPGYVFKDRDKARHVTSSDLTRKFGLKTQTIYKLIRQGKIKPRVIPNGISLFLKTDNPDLPKIIEDEIKTRA